MQSCNISKNNFWITSGPLFSDKAVRKAKKILLIEENEIISLNRFSFQIDMQNIRNFEKPLIQLIIAMIQTDANSSYVTRNIIFNL